MADSIESFVSKLQDEGVEAGKKEAEKIRAEAQAEADRIVKEAEQKARKIIEDAQQEARDTKERGRTDLQLAARDTVLRLRETLSNALQAVLVTGTEGPLRDPDFLKTLIHDVVMQYTRADREGKVNIQVTVSDEVKDQLTDWCRQQLNPEAEQGGAGVDIRGSLAEAGFEYEAEGATIEVTLSSVVETLAGLVSPRLREMLREAAQQAPEPADSQDQPNPQPPQPDQPENASQQDGR